MILLSDEEIQDAYAEAEIGTDFNSGARGIAKAQLKKDIRWLFDAGYIRTNFHDKDDEGYPCPELEQRKDLLDEFLNDHIPRVFELMLSLQELKTLLKEVDED